METIDSATESGDGKGGARSLPWQAKAALGTLVVCALLALFWPSGSGRTDAPGGFLLDAAGRPSPLGPRLTPVTLVHFWSTWCPPCIEEVPALGRLTRELSSNPDFSVLMIAVADDPGKVTTFVGAGGGDMMLFDPNWDVAHRYGTRQLPETYLVVRGKVLEKFVGQTNWDDPALRRRLAALLGDSRPAS